MDDRELEEQLLPKLVQIHGEPLDPNVLAAYVDGALSGEEHAEVAARIAADPDALMLVRALEEDRDRTTTRNWTLAALAASVLLAVGLWWGNRDPVLESLDLGGRLSAVTADLGRSAPDLFGAFEPLAADDLEAKAGVTRGGPRWFAPVGVLREKPRELRWSNPPGATRAEVAIIGDGFRWKQDVEGERAAAPALEPGQYVVTLRSLDTLAAQPIRRVFEIVDAAREADLARSLAQIRETAPADLVDLVVAHFAVRQRMFDVARAAALSAQARGGEVGAAATALLAHVDIVASAK